MEFLLSVFKVCFSYNKEGIIIFTIEEYIAKRKQEDKLNEFDLDKRLENIKSCIDYIFEYYNNYLDISEIDQRTIINNERLNKYRKQLSNYCDNIQDWLVDTYDKHGNCMNRIIGNLLEDNELFFAMNTDGNSEIYLMNIILI